MKGRDDMTSKKDCVNLYIQLARITEDESKRNEYIRNAEKLLNDITYKQEVVECDINRTIQLFMNENSDVIRISTKRFYEMYLMFCRRNLLNALPKNLFSKQLRKFYGYKSQPLHKTKSDRSERYYIKERT